MVGCFKSKSVLTLYPLLQHEREFGPFVQAASATNDVDEDATEDALLAEDTAEEADVTEDALVVEDALLADDADVARRTILPILSAPHR